MSKRRSAKKPIPIKDTSRFKYQDKEKVLCYHGPLIYEAKCLKLDIRDNEPKYYIHYNGWNKNWDEWVPESRILKFNDENVKTQKEIEALHTKDNVKPKSKSKASKKKKSTKESSPAIPQKEEPDTVKSPVSEEPIVPKPSKASSKPRASTRASTRTPARSSSPTPTRASTRSSTAHPSDGSQAAIPKKVPDEPVTQKTTVPAPTVKPVRTSSRIAALALKRTLASLSLPPPAPTSARTPARGARAPPKPKSLAAEFASAARAACLASQPKYASTSASRRAPARKPRKRRRRAGGYQRPRKRAKYVPREEPEPFLINLKIRINFTEQMKKWLDDDCDTITRVNRLYTLPSKFTVDKLLKSFILFKKNKGNLDKKAKSHLIKFTNGIRRYFNSLLGKILLYKFERWQYLLMYNKAPNKPASKIYGGIYLLRLFAYMNSILTYKVKTVKHRNQIRRLVPQIDELLEYLASRPKIMFSFDNYEVASLDYQRMTLL